MKYFKLFAAILLLPLLASCGSSRRVVNTQQSLPQLSAEEQRKYDYYFLEAVKLRGQKSYDAAFDMLQHALTINPNAASGLYELSQYYLFLRMLPQGQEAMEKAMLNDPENFWYAQALVNLYQHQSMNDKAIALLEDMANRFPNRRESLFTLVDLYGQIEEYDKVIATLDRIENALGKNEQLSMEKFRIYWQKGDSEKAFNEIKGLVQEYPLDNRYRVLLGDTYLQNGKPDEAFDSYQEVLNAEPDNVLAMLSLAGYYEETGQDSLYQQQIGKILYAKEVAAEDKMNIMRQLVVRNEQRGEDSTKIINIFDKIIEIDTEDDQLPMLYAQYLWSKGMENESEPVLKRILNIDPANKAVRLMALQIALRKTDYKAMEEICEPGIVATPEALEFYFYLTIAHYQNDKNEEALKVANQAIKQINANSPKDIVADLYSIIGDLNHTLGNNDAAYSAYDTALTYNPNNIGVLNNYAYYLSVEKRDLDKAEEMSYRTVKAEPENSTYLDTYAWILFEKESYPMALIYIDKALASGGNESSVILEHAGDIYFMNGKKDEAVELWKKAKELGSESKTLNEKIRKKKYIAE